MIQKVCRTSVSSVATAWIVVGVGLGLGGCMTASTRALDSAEGRPEVPSIRRSAYRDRASQAYYHFSIAQMEARQGRTEDAIAELRAAIKDDPSTGFLWVQLSQWLLRTGDMPGALEAAQRLLSICSPKRLRPWQPRR